MKKVVSLDGKGVFDFVPSEESKRIRKQKQEERKRNEGQKGAGNQGKEQNTNSETEMKEQIERKVGCSIEECLSKIERRTAENMGYETDTPAIFSGLTDEEYDFLESYISRTVG